MPKLFQGDKFLHSHICAVVRGMHRLQLAIPLKKPAPGREDSGRISLLL